MGLRHAKTVGTLPSAQTPVTEVDWDADHVVDGSLDFPVVATPSPPAAGYCRVFGRDVGGRILPAIIGPSGLDTSLQPLLARNKIAWMNPNGNSTVVGLLGLAITASGTATAANVATTNIHQAMRRLNYLVTTAATSALAGFRTTAAQYHIGDNSNPFGGFFYVCRFGRPTGAAAISTLRGFTGFTSATTAPTDADPSAGTNTPNAIGVGCDAGDANYQIMHRTGTGTTTKINTGIPKADSDASEMYELALFTAPTGSPTVGYQFTRLSDNTIFAGSITTNLPAATTLLALRNFYSVGGTSSVIGYALASLYVETDY